jgi:hypothetical protein
MGEKTVITDRQAKTGEEPHREKQADIDGADGPIEQQAQGDERTQKGQHIEDDEMPPLQLVKMAASDYPIVAHSITAILGMTSICS